MHMALVHCFDVITYAYICFHAYSFLCLLLLLIACIFPLKLTVMPIPFWLNCYCSYMLVTHLCLLLCANCVTSYPFCLLLHLYLICACIIALYMPILPLWLLITCMIVHCHAPMFLSRGFHTWTVWMSLTWTVLMIKDFSQVFLKHLKENFHTH